MKTLLFSFLLLISVQLVATELPVDSCNHQLYYVTPATIWEETLPLGNGRLGIMPDGGIRQEHIVLNEISLWSGMEADYGNPDASHSLPAIRQLLFEGKNKEAQELMYNSFVPKKEETDGRYGTYQVLGDLNIDFTYNTQSPTLNSQSVDYRRWLDLHDAVAYTTFMCDGVNYRREYFVSRDHDVILVHLTADRKGALNFSAKLSRTERCTVTADGNTLRMNGALESGKAGQDGMKYSVAMRLISKSGKQAVSSERGMTLIKGKEAWLVISATTSYAAEGTDFLGERYVEVCDSLLEVMEPLVTSAKQSHIAAHRTLYDRVSLTLPATEDDALPTNERILRFAEKGSPALAALYYNYGRYLLISSTRPGSCHLIFKDFGQPVYRHLGMVIIILISMFR